MDQLERVKVEVGVGNQNPAIGQRCRPDATTDSAGGVAAGNRRRHELCMRDLEEEATNRERCRSAVLAS